MYEVYISKRVLKNIRHMPIPVQRKMVNLIDDLRDKGPIRPEWPNFSKLVSDHYHCHLTYKWAVCWTYRQQGNRIEVIVQAVVKTPRIEIAIRGKIPPKLLAILEEEFGDEMQLHADDDDEMVDVFETAWYTNLKKQITPGMNLKIYRDNYGLTQNQLG